MLDVVISEWRLTSVPENTSKCERWSPSKVQWAMRVTVLWWTLWWVKNRDSSSVAAHSYKTRMDQISGVILWFTPWPLLRPSVHVRVSVWEEGKWREIETSQVYRSLVRDKIFICPLISVPDRHRAGPPWPDSPSQQGNTVSCFNVATFWGDFWPNCENQTKKFTVETWWAAVVANCSMSGHRGVSQSLSADQLAASRLQS